MRKFIITLIAVALAVPAFAGDFEISGHVNTGFAYNKTNANIVTGGGTTTTAGALPELSGIANNADDQNFEFFVDEVEVDLEKEWGENFRARADISVAAGGAVTLEQAYTTVNLPVGNGAEFLVGRFDAPIGFESNERGENTLASHGTIFRALRPTTLLGVKFYYPFSDMVDLHLYLVNNLQNIANGTGSDAPSAGFRLGFGWGDMDQQNTFGLSFAAGQERGGASTSQELTWLVDADWNIWLSDAFALGGELLYRTDGSAGTKPVYYAGQLNLLYEFSDVWDGTLRYGYASDKASTGVSAFNAANASLLNTEAVATGKTQIHSITLGGQYHIADNAKLQLEFGYDIEKAAATGNTYGAAFNFAYNF